MNELVKSQLSNMVKNCGACFYKESPKVPLPDGPSPCYTCMYNAIMIKTNNFRPATELA